jgi:hypothetical protein
VNDIWGPAARSVGAQFAVDPLDGPILYSFC